MILKNKVVLVSGSTTGIGEAIAKHCVAAGAKVLIHGRDEERAKALCEELGKEVSAFHLCELSDPNISDKLIQATIEAFGRIDSLINNAGIYPRNNINDLNDEFFDHVITVNLKVPMFLTQRAVSEFRRQKSGGTIINIGSINAYCGQTDLLVYSVSKGGLMTMTRNLGDALAGENIRINQINVGWTVTENERATQKKQGRPDDWEKYVPKHYAPSGRLLQPDDVARHVVFWASDYSAPVSGQVYELEQYPVIGRNLLNLVNFDEIIQKKSK